MRFPCFSSSDCEDELDVVGDQVGNLFPSCISAGDARNHDSRPFHWSTLKKHRSGLFWDQKKKHPSVTTNIISRRHVPPMWHEKTEDITQFDGYRVCATRRKQRTALHDGVQVTAELQRCQLTIQPAFENADRAFLFFQHCCIFFVFACRPNIPVFFCEMCGRICKRKAPQKKIVTKKR